jgi:hypothetical protein
MPSLIANSLGSIDFSFNKSRNTMPGFGGCSVSISFASSKFPCFEVTKRISYYLSNVLLKLFLVFAVLPVLSSVNGANGKSVTKTTNDLIEPVPIIEMNVDCEVLTGEPLGRVRDVQLDGTCNEAALVVRGGGMSTNGSVCKA